MRITSRDVRLIKDIALSHLLSRDQIIELGYFGSVTRANTRIRELTKLGMLGKLTTPFFSQTLYAARPKASEIVGVQIAQLINARKQPPRFVQHALSVTNARIYLLGHGASNWRFEQQLRASFDFAGRVFEVRPDGMAVFEGKGLLAVEVDLGHVSIDKFSQKLRAFESFVASGECKRNWGQDSFRLLTLTTGSLRASKLSRLSRPITQFEHVCQPLDHFGIKPVGSWS